MMNGHLLKVVIRNERRIAGLFVAVILAACSVLTPCLYTLAEEKDTAAEAYSGGETAADAADYFLGKNSGFSAVLYDNESGLPTSEANAIAQTSEGFIWIGSYSGLIRHDGNSFERISSSVGISSIIQLYVDSKDRLWIGTNDSGVAVMEKGEFRIYNRSDGLGALTVRDIDEDSSGNIYIATTGGMAYVDTDLNMHIIDDPALEDLYVRHIQIVGNDLLYGITMSGAVFLMKDGRVIKYFTPEDLGIDNIHSMCADENNPGYVYIGDTGSRVYYGVLDEKGFAVKNTINIAPLSYVNSVEYSSGVVWVCTDSGLGYISRGFFHIVSGVPMNTSLEHVMTDYQGNLWFVSSRQGVMKVVPNQFTDVFEQYGLSDTVVNAVIKCDDRLYIGTKSEGLIALENGEVLDAVPISSSFNASGKRCVDKDLLDMFRGCRIRSLFRDSKDRIWICTFGDNPLVRYENGKVLKFTADDGLPSERVRCVYEKEDGSFLVACTGGLAVIENDKIVRVYDEDDGIDNTEILTCAEDYDGNPILGTDGGGIYRITDHGTEHFGTMTGMYSDVVMRIKRDISRDLLWIVTSNSIAYMDRNCNVTTIEKFPYSNNFDLYENDLGEMWVLGSNGIYVADVDDVLDDGNFTTVYYGTDNGLPCIANANSYSELTDDGDLYIAGSTGVAYVNIEKRYENVKNFKMAVPFIEADGEFIYPDEDGNFTVSDDVERVTVYSYVFNYSLMNPEVTYRLEGFEKKDTTVRRSELNPIGYTNLHGGDYTFVMNVKDPRGLSSTELRVNIHKRRAFFEHIMVRMLLALALMMAIGFGARLYADHRMSRLIAKAEEQKTLIREMVEAFARIIDMKDDYTRGHSTRVAEYTAMLARELGYDEEEVEKYYNIALLHDIGKIGIDKEVLHKDGKLTEEEFQIIKSHTTLGYDALKDISIMPELATGAGCHHERPDGKGYPRGLKGDEIPRVAQIISVADTFDAMYSKRHYRPRMKFEKVVSIIKEVRGTQLQADVVDAFLRLVDEGKFRAPDDTGEGSEEAIENIK